MRKFVTPSELAKELSITLLPANYDFARKALVAAMENLQESNLDDDSKLFISTFIRSQIWD